MTTIAQTSTQSRTKTAALWTLQIVTAGMFVLAGSSKLAGAPAMVQLFSALGLGQWFRYVTGGIEVVSAAFLLVPSLAFFGAAALTVTMIGAAITHLFIVGGNAAPAIVLLVATATIAWTKLPIR